MSVLLHCAGDPAQAEADQGPGPSVLCAPAGADYATRLYPYRRIEVKPAWSDPKVGAGAVSLFLFLSGFRAGPETPEALKRRVVDCATLLIGAEKKDGEGVLVAGPVLTRLVGLKLVSIGYSGPFLSAPRPGSRRLYLYRP